MAFTILMGVPEMKEFWDNLMDKYNNGTISKLDAILLEKVDKTIELISANPKYPSLHTHDIDDLTERMGFKVWQSYVENKTSGALRIFWCYGPKQGYITIVGLSNHPESSKRGAYNKITLSNFPKIKESLFWNFFNKFGY